MFNKLSDDNIVLDIAEHEYSLKDDAGFSFISVTTFLAKFFDKFDAESIAVKLVSTSPKYMHLTLDQLLNKWKLSGEHGTNVHNQIENYIKDKTTPSELKAINGIKWLKEFVFGKDTRFYAEEIVYAKKLKLAGTIDLLVENQDGSYTIIDWKTNAKLTMTAFKNKKGIHPITNTLDDCKFTLYSLQLSLYRYILENFYNLKIRDLIVAHLQDDGVKAYLAPYYINEMKEFAKLIKEQECLT